MLTQQKKGLLKSVLIWPKVTYNHCRHLDTTDEQKGDHQPTIHHHLETSTRRSGCTSSQSFYVVGVSWHHCLLSWEALSSLWPHQMPTWKQNFTLFLTFLQRTDQAQTHQRYAVRAFPEAWGKPVWGSISHTWVEDSSSNHATKLRPPCPSPILDAPCTGGSLGTPHSASLATFHLLDFSWPFILHYFIIHLIYLCPFWVPITRLYKTRKLPDNRTGENYWLLFLEHAPGDFTPYSGNCLPNSYINR